MGLLDSFNLDLEDPKTLGLISMAAQLIGGAPGGRKNFGADLSAGIQQGLLGYTQGKQGQMKRQAFDQDAQMRKMQMGQLERQNADQDAVRNAFSQNLQPGGPQMQPNDYETPTGPNGPSSLNIPGLQQALMRAGPAGMPHLAQLSAMNAKNYQKLSEGDSLFDMSAPGGPKAVASAAPKLPTGMVMGPNGPTFMPEYIKGQRDIRAAGKTDVTTNIMPPREIFKDSMSLKKDFDGQPEVKGFKEVQSAWDQISGALKNPSAANDLAAATKFMKLLDPGSVVRESELAMAMQASGSLDRFMNMANRIKSGEKLTPTQRQDFFTSGEALYNASKNRFGQTIDQYQGIAKQYGLDAQFLPKPGQEPPKGKSVTMGGKQYDAKQAPDGNYYIQFGKKWFRVEDQ